MYFDDGDVVAQHLNLKTLALEGERTVVAGNVSYNKPFDRAAFSASGDVLLFEPSSLRPTQLVQLDRAGKLMRAIGEPSFHRYVRLSPDGKQAIEFRMDPRNQDGDFFIRDLEHGTDLRFTSDAGLYSRPVWSPDGRAIVYGASLSGAMDLFLQPLDSPSGNVILSTPKFKIACDWSRDGQWLLFEDVSTTTGWDLWLLHVGHHEPPVPFLQSKHLEVDGSFSPDGRFIAYDSNEAGSFDVYIRSRDGGHETRVSTHGGAGAQWRADGRELYYMTREGTIMVVDVTTQPSLQVGTPHALFDTTAEFLPIDFASFAPAPDGQSFFVSQQGNRDEVHVINAIINWRSGLK